MKFSIHSSLSLSARALLPGLALTVLTGYVAVATPYATSITNDGSGIVSFRLNQTTGTNDLVQIISNGGVLTNTLQSPGGNPITRGLNFYTNASIAAGTVKIHISHLGTGAITTNGPAIDLAFGTPRGITCNIRTNSPYFGWVYLSNAATNSNAHGAGIFAFGSDLSD